MFEKFENRFTLRGMLVTTTGLHVGKGASLEPVGSDSPVVKDILSAPMVPGSSFRGVLRSRIEAMLRGLGEDACDIVQSGCVSADKVSDWRVELRNHGLNELEVDEELTRRILKKSCWVCKLFGSSHLASKVQIKDIHHRGEWHGFYEVRDGVAIERDTETAGKEKKFDYEVVPSGTEFDVEIVVENATDEQLGLLFLGLREFEKGVVSIGGNTSRGLGRVQLSWEEAEWVDSKDRNRFLEYLRTNKGEMYYSEEAKEESEDTIGRTEIPEDESHAETSSQEAPSESSSLQEAFNKVVQAIQIVESRGQPTNASLLGSVLGSELGLNKRELALQNIANSMTELLTKAVKAGVIRLEGDAYRVVEAELKISDSAEIESEQPSNEQEKGKFLNKFIEEKIAAFIKALEKGGKNAQTTTE